jgi:hypothetical protein
MSTEMDFYSQYVPVLKKPGWEQTGIQNNSVIFANVIFDVPSLKITVRIIIFQLTSWQYSASFSTPYHCSDIDVPPDYTLSWEQVREYYLEHGLAAYEAHEKDVKSRVEEDYKRALQNK